MSPAEGAAVYTQICQEWGAEKLAAMEGVERLGEILEKVVASASPLGAPSSSAGATCLDPPIPARPARSNSHR